MLIKMTSLISAIIFALPQVSLSQVPPSTSEQAQYSGLLAAASRGNLEEVKALLANGADVHTTDTYGRTPLHVAAYAGHHEVMRVLVNAGADPNVLENDDYDIVTIAAVANDIHTLELALALGTSAGNITSPYEGTALIAAAHLGHTEVVQILIRHAAPLDHVNNLGWTAVIEAIVLGDGGPRHIETLEALIKAGADLNLPDRNAQTPLALARTRGYNTMAKMLEQAGAR